MSAGATQRLPESWKFVELREVGQIVTGSTPPKARKEFYGGSFPFVKPPELRHCPVGDAGDKLTEKGAEVADVAPAGSVLVSCIGNLGKTGRATQPVAFNQQINAIIPHRPEDSKWVFYAVQAPEFASQLAMVASATTIAIVNKGKFSGLRIPLAPDHERRRIVAEIEKQFTRLEAGVAGLRRAQANLKRYRAAVLKAAVEGKLVPTEAELARAEGRVYETGEQLLDRILTERRQKWVGRGKYKEPAAPDTTNLPSLPEGWTRGTLEQLTDASAPVLYGILQPGADLEEGTPYVRPTEIVRDTIDLSSIRRTSPKIAAKYQRSVLRSGDIILSIVGTIGKVAVVPSALDGGNVTQSSVRIRPGSANINGPFLAWALRSPILTRQYDLKRLGTAVPRLNVEDVRLLFVPLPSLAEQERIVAEVERRLSVVEELEAVVSANLQRATRLRQSILQRAFEGKLVSRDYERTSDVPQDLPIAAEPSSTYGGPR